METDVNTNQNQSTIPLERAITVIEGEGAKEVTAHGAVKPENKREEAYVIRDDLFDDFIVTKSVNAWWMDAGKLRKLIDAFKSGMSIKGACNYAGISRKKFYYFTEVHPLFWDLIEDLDGVQEVGFINLINTEGKKDLATARWYLERNNPKFSRQKVERDVRPNSIINNGNIQINTNNVDAAEIAKAIERVADALIQGQGSGGDEQSDRRGLEEESEVNGV